MCVSHGVREKKMKWQPSMCAHFNRGGIGVRMVHRSFTMSWRGELCWLERDLHGSRGGCGGQRCLFWATARGHKPCEVGTKSAYIAFVLQETRLWSV